MVYVAKSRPGRRTLTRRTSRWSPSSACCTASLSRACSAALHLGFGGSRSALSRLQPRGRSHVETHRESRRGGCSDHGSGRGWSAGRGIHGHASSRLPVVRAYWAVAARPRPLSQPNGSRRGTADEVHPEPEFRPGNPCGVAVRRYAGHSSRMPANRSKLQASARQPLAATAGNLREHSASFRHSICSPSIGYVLSCAPPPRSLHFAFPSPHRPSFWPWPCRWSSAAPGGGSSGAPTILPWWSRKHANPFGDPRGSAQGRGPERRHHRRTSTTVTASPWPRPGWWCSPRCRSRAGPGASCFIDHVIGGSRLVAMQPNWRWRRR